MGYVGGLRRRLVYDSVAAMIRNGLDDLGWFDPGRDHDEVKFVERPSGWEEKISFNSVAITAEDTTDDPAEMGSNLTDDTWNYSVDVYAEDEPVGIALSGDIFDIVRGKMPSIGRTGPILYVIDFSAATPSRIFTCDIVNPGIDRAHGFPKAWQQHWWAVNFQIIDTYNDETDD